MNILERWENKLLDAYLDDQECRCGDRCQEFSGCCGGCPECTDDDDDYDDRMEEWKAELRAERWASRDW